MSRSESLLLLLLPLMLVTLGGREGEGDRESLSTMIMMLESDYNKI